MSIDIKEIIIKGAYYMINGNKVYIKNTIMMFFMTIARYIFPLITFPYLTRVLQPDYYGIVTYMTATMSYFQLLIDFGFKFSATKVASENRDNKKVLGELIGNVYLSKLILSLIGLLFLLVMISFIEILNWNIGLTLLYYLSVVVTIFLPDFLYSGIEKMEIITLRYIITKLVSVILTIIFVKSKSDIILIPIFSIVGTLASALFTYYNIINILKIKIKWGSIYGAITNLKMSYIYFLSTFATTAFGATNTFIMGIMNLSTGVIAYWGVANQIISIIIALYDPLISSIYPRLVSRKDYTFVKNILIIVMPIIIIGVVVLYIFSDYIIVLIAGANYLDAIPILRVLLPVIVFSFPTQMIGFPVLGTMKKEYLVTISTIISACFQTISLILLILLNNFTLMNLAIIRSITEVIMFSIRLIFLKLEYSKLKYSNKLYI